VPPAGTPPAAAPVIQRGIIPDQPPPVEDWGSRTNYADPGLVPSALRAGSDWLKGPGFTTAVRGVGDFINMARNPGAALTSPFATLISPEYEKRYQSTLSQPGTELGNTVFNTTGIPEYQGQSGPERTLMAAGRGGIANLPLGFLGGARDVAGRMLPAFVGLESGAAGQATRELLPPGPMTERVATLASAAPAVVAGINAATAPRRAEVPSTTELYDRGSRGFDATRASPTEISPYPLQARTRAAEAQVYQQYDPMMMPQTQRIIQNRIMQGGSLDMNDVINLRKQLTQTIQDNRSSIPGTGNAHEVALATAILRELDDHVANLGNNPAHVTAGTPAEATATATTYQDARANTGAALRSNAITGELLNSQGLPRERGVMGEAQTAAEKQNAPSYDRTLRDTLARFTNPKNPRLGGYIPDEVAALNDAMRGSALRNTLRNIAATLGGKFSAQQAFTGSSGAALSHMFGLDPLTSAAVGAAVPALGGAARLGQTALARGEIGRAAETVRMRSPAYEEALRNLPPRDIAVIRSILPGLLAPPTQPGMTGRGLLAEPEPPGGWIY
jgi:hypothetical protein